jgi:GTP cyclohydrolase I
VKPTPIRGTAGKPEDLIRIMLCLLEGNPELREGIKDTPDRVIRSWAELYRGYHMDPKEILSRDFDRGTYDQMVSLRNINFFSTCEHHMLPFYGVAHVAYIPGERVVGLSKLARLVDCFSRRLQIQERMTAQIGEALVDVLKPRGVAVLVESKHLCMIARGVQKQEATMRTTFVAGLLKEDDKARAEFMSSIK